jgi:hypothetical protein
LAILPLVSMGGASFVTIDRGPGLPRMTPVGVRICRRLTTCVSLELGHETPRPWAKTTGERVKCAIRRRSEPKACPIALLPGPKVSYQCYYATSAWRRTHENYNPCPFGVCHNPRRRSGATAKCIQSRPDQVRPGATRAAARSAAGCAGGRSYWGLRETSPYV